MMALDPMSVDNWFVGAILALLLGVLVGRAVVHLLLRSPWIAIRRQSDGHRRHHVRSKRTWRKA